MARWMVPLVLLLVLTGCGGTKETKEWTATVQVEDSVAVVTVDVPGKEIGRDYHPHLKLNDGPEIMMYTSSYSFKDLKPGSYTLLVQIQTPNHRVMDGMERTLTFEVK